MSTAMMRRDRLRCLAQGALSAHEPVEPEEPEIKVWVHERKKELIETYTNITEGDPRYKVMYSHPMQALILYSQLCTNWWCGPAAVTVFEMLAARFDGMRGDALTNPREYVAALRVMTNGIMRSFPRGTSLYHHKLEPDSDNTAKKITVALKGLRGQGVPPIAPSPAAPACPVSSDGLTCSLHHPRRPHHR